jgi:hypothetical protein
LKKTLHQRDLLEIKDCLRKIGGKNPVYRQIGRWCAKQTTAVNDVTEQINEDAQDTFGNSQFGYEFNMDKQVDIALESKRQDVCRICYQEPLDSHVAQVS